MTRLALLLAAALAAPLLPAHAEEGAYLPPVADATVAKECGACHMVFPPQLLPARSWQKLMADLSSHFGEDASLADPGPTDDHGLSGRPCRRWPGGAAAASASCAGLSAADTP